MEEPTQIKVRLIDDQSKSPERKSAGAAGYDVFAHEDTVVPACGRALVHLGFSILIPQGYYGRMAPRSGLSLKGIDIAAGVIDSDYRGEVCAVIVNTTYEDFKITCGMRVAQLIIEKIATPEIEIVDSLPDTERGEKGFGSTGL